jgi:D-glycerate 3-kinase
LNKLNEELSKNKELKKQIKQLKNDNSNIELLKEKLKKLELSDNVNKLEKDKEIVIIWRKRVNTELKKNYKKIFELIDKLIFLRVPSFKYVFVWRLLQEKKLRITSKGNKTMTNRQIKNFIMYYERLTKHMLKTLPKKAIPIISIDKKHMLKSIKFN